MNEPPSNDALKTNKESWDAIATTFSGTVLPRYGPLACSETELNLLGDIRGKRILEIGCASGRSLLFLAQNGAAELWGLDFSRVQIKLAALLLESNQVTHHLFESPMEQNPGLPQNYFDLVVSIYALGWSVNLSDTMRHIAWYLKPGGTFVFSWEHPVYHCLEYEGDRYVFKKSYQIEGPEQSPLWKGVPVIHQRRKISTYLNALVAAGLSFERLIESELDVKAVQDKHLAPEYWYSAHRAKLIPTTMIVQARKPETKVDPTT